MLAGQSKRGTACRKHQQPGGRGEESRDELDVGEELLEVVQDEEQSLLAQELPDCLVE